MNNKRQARCVLIYMDNISFLQVQEFYKVGVLASDNVILFISGPLVAVLKRVRKLQFIPGKMMLEVDAKP